MPLTVGALRAALADLPDAMVIWVEFDNRCSGDEAEEAFIEHDRFYGDRLAISTGD